VWISDLGIPWIYHYLYVASLEGPIVKLTVFYDDIYALCAFHKSTFLE